VVNIRVNVVFHRIICKLLKIKTRVNVVNVVHVGKSSLGSIVNFVYLVNIVDLVRKFLASRAHELQMR